MITPITNTTMPHPNRITIEDIPPEVLMIILSILLEISDAENTGNGNTIIQATLSACRLTCKYLNTLAQPFIFSRISLGCERPGALDKSLRRIAVFRELMHVNSTLGAEVKEVVLHGYQHNEDTDETPSTAETQTRQFWANPALLSILNKLCSVRSFTLTGNMNSNRSYVSAGGGVWDSEHHDVSTSGELREAVMRVCCLPSVVRVRVGNAVGLFPLSDVLARALNLAFLDIDDAEQEGAGHDGQQLVGTGGAVGGELDTPESTLMLRPRFGVLRLVSVEWNPQVMTVLSRGYGPEDLNAIICASKHTITHLALHFRPQSSYNYSNALTPPLGVYKSLKSFKAQWHTGVSAIFSTVLATFITHQFSTASSSSSSPELGITHFEIRAHYLSATTFKVTLKDVHPTEWHTLDRAISTTFPHLKTLVISLAGAAFRPRQMLFARVFFKHVLPVTTAMAGTRVLLRIDELGEVDMTMSDSESHD